MPDAAAQVAEERHGRTVTVTVNNRPVSLESHRVTGLGIKQAAIAQGVPIQLDFQLAEIRPNGEHKVIGDGDVVTVTDHSQFVATAADDNS